MKKILLSLFAVFALMSVAQLTFAAPTYKSTTQSISEALKPKLPGEFGNDTVISVINYSNYKVVVTYPTFNPLDSEVSTRISASNYTGPTFIRIQENYGPNGGPVVLGPVIFEGNMYYRSTISIHNGYPKYQIDWMNN